MNMTMLVLFFTLTSNNTLRLSEDDAVRLALERNAQIKAAEKAVESAKWDVRKAKGAFMPSITTSTSYAHLSFVQKMLTARLDYLEPGPGGIFIPHYHFEEMPFGMPDNYSFDLSVSYPIFTWGARLNALRAAQKQLEIQRIELEATRIRTEAQVRKLYYAALMTREMLNLARSAYNEKKSHYESVKTRYENGYASDFELLRAEVEWKNAEPSVIEAENAYKSTIDALKLMLNIPHDTEIELTDSLDYPQVEFDLDSLILEAQRQRLDLKELDVQIEMLKRLRSAQDAADKPALVASWSYSFKKPFGFEDKWGGSWTAVIAFQFPLFDGFQTRSAVNSMDAQIHQLRIMRGFAQRAAIMEVKEAFRNFKAAKDMIESQAENVRLAKKMYEMAKEQYDNGFASSLDVIDAEVAYLAARANYISALVQYKSAIVELELAVKAGKGETQAQQPQMQQGAAGMEAAPTTGGGGATGGQPQQGASMGGGSMQQQFGGGFGGMMGGGFGM